MAYRNHTSSLLFMMMTPFAFLVISLSILG